MHTEFASFSAGSCKSDSRQQPQASVFADCNTPCSSRWLAGQTQPQQESALARIRGLTLRLDAARVSRRARMHTCGRVSCQSSTDVLAVAACESARAELFDGECWCEDWGARIEMQGRCGSTTSIQDILASKLAPRPLEQRRACI